MAPPQHWWLETGGRVFGPYEIDQLAGFLKQGRLAAASRLAASPQGPFAPAGSLPALAVLFPHAQSSSAKSPLGERPLIVLAALLETPSEALEGVILTFGPAVKIRGAFWVCRARLSAAGMRNALSRRLRPGEFLFVAEVQGADTAWFNLDADIDRAVRKLWA